jgi:hypothetical protein
MASVAGGPGQDPAATGYNATGTTNVPHTAEIVANQMVVPDEDGNGCGCHRLVVWASIAKGK